ncbi:MAG TPA: hypothetical protein PKU93_02700 [Candidatus Pacearchaeota archaeon]|nr:hypothetical protein [Candidatus Pacearchaeota archaeon]
MPELEKRKEPKSINKKLILTISTLVILITVIVIYLKLTDKNVVVDVYVPMPEGSMQVGLVGSVGENEKIEEINPNAIENPVRDLDIPVPTDIFHTSGTITAIQANSVVIKGIGTNFDDQMKRDLIVVINETTTVNGVNGSLDYFKDNLKIGEEIVIEAPYNIHGKTEFLAKYITTVKE